METYILNQDIKVFGFKAKSFPEGLKEVFEKLHEVAPIKDNRTYYGISYPENGKIRYSAHATEITKGELGQMGIEEFVIKQGKYLYLDIKDFTKNIPSIEKSFNTLIKDKRIDPKGVCVEWYLNDSTCRCMIKMKD